MYPLKLLINVPDNKDQTAHETKTLKRMITQTMRLTQENHHALTGHFHQRNTVRSKVSFCLVMV